MKNAERTLFFSMTYEFLEVYMPKRLGRSAQTIRSYRDALTVFRRFLLEKKGLSVAKFYMDDCNRECLDSFVAYLKESGNTNGTCNQRLAAIKSYMWFAAENDVALQSIAINVSKTPPCKTAKKESEILEDDALAALFSLPQNTKLGLRDRTIMIMLYDTAVRINELLSIKLRDLNISGKNPYVLVHGKGNKERIVALAEKTVTHLQNYLKVYHQNPGTDDYLFYTVIKGKTDKMSPGNVERLIQRYANKVRELGIEIPQKVYPHMFRRTRATNLYRGGVELELVSKILGHSMIETTKIYAIPSPEQMRNAMESVKTYGDHNELPLWEGSSEEEMARLCGLR